MAKTHRIPPALGWIRRSDGKPLNIADCLNHHGDAFNAIDYFHDKTHRAVTFTSGWLWNTLANAANGDVLIRVAARPAHMEFNARVGGDCIAHLYEGVTVTTPGIAVAVFNRVRIPTYWPAYGASSDEGNTVLIYLGPSFTGGTDLMGQGHYIVGGTGPQSAGGAGGDRHEHVLNPNTDYVARLTNISGLGKIVDMDLDWYEHEVDFTHYE